MNLSLNRVVLYVQDVPRLVAFYRGLLGLPVVEEWRDEWAVLRAGHCEIALHRAGKAFRNLDAGLSWEKSNAKLVLAVEGDMAALRKKLMDNGVAMREIKSYTGFTGPICDGTDPEGNVFQLAQQ
jgi:catechol 2,3-dioxygenase-like lactoylglutathione lyase family enzyme